jgi:hypothetical protein
MYRVDMSANETSETALSRLVHRFESGWERHKIKDLRALLRRIFPAESALLRQINKFNNYRHLPTFVIDNGKQPVK